MVSDTGSVIVKDTAPSYFPGGGAAVMGGLADDDGGGRGGTITRSTRVVNAAEAAAAIAAAEAALAASSLDNTPPSSPSSQPSPRRNGGRDYPVLGGAGGAGGPPRTSGSTPRFSVGGGGGGGAGGKRGSGSGNVGSRNSVGDGGGGGFNATSGSRDGSEAPSDNTVVARSTPSPEPESPKQRRGATQSPGGYGGGQDGESGLDSGLLMRMFIGRQLTDEEQAAVEASGGREKHGPNDRRGDGGSSAASLQSSPVGQKGIGRASQAASRGGGARRRVSGGGGGGGGGSGAGRHSASGRALLQDDLSQPRLMPNGVAALTEMIQVYGGGGGVRRGGGDDDGGGGGGSKTKAEPAWNERTAMFHPNNIMAHALRYYVVDDPNVEVGTTPGTAASAATATVPSYTTAMLLRPPTTSSSTSTFTSAAMTSMPSRVELQDMLRDHGRADADAAAGDDTDNDDDSNASDEEEEEEEEEEGKEEGEEEGERRRRRDNVGVSDFFRVNAEALREKLRGVPYVKASDLAPLGYGGGHRDVLSTAAANVAANVDPSRSHDDNNDNLDTVPLDALHEEDPLRLARAYCRAAEVPEWVGEVMLERRNIDIMVRCLAWHRGFANGAGCAPVKKGACRRLRRALSYLLGF